MNPLESVTKILTDPVAGPYVAGTAWHCYYGDATLIRQTYHSPGHSMVTFVW